jgi:hypothetical protein
MIEMHPLTRSDLDFQSCDRCCAHSDDEPLYLESRCHPESGTRTAYYKGGLRITCHTCDTLLTVIAVAD